MKNPLAFGYVLIGFIVGLGFGVITEKQSALTFERLAFFFSLLVLIGLWQWIEYANHKRNLQKWESIRSRGKWYFIATRYLLTRGSIAAVLMLAPFFSVLKLSGTPLLVLILTSLMAILSLTYLGYCEWSRCEEEAEILALRKAVAHLADPSSSIVKGG